MGLKRGNKHQLKQLAALWLCALLAAPSALARDYNYNKDMTQQDAMGYGSNNYWNGSGDSKDEGVRNGMRAMGRLASLDIGGAIHYGYKGYGNYINSQKMDDLDARAWKKKDTMNSITNGMIGGASGGGSSTNGGEAYSAVGPEREAAKLPSGANGKSTNGESAITGKKWKDMDKGFLYRGETGEVAAEFEKKTGMSRDEFFNHVANAADSNLSFDDPNLMNNLEQRFQAFKAGVRNQDFKDKLDKVHSMFSFMKKTEMLQEAASFYYAQRGPLNPPDQMLAGGAAKGDASTISASGNGGTSSAMGERALASDSAPLLAAQSNFDPSEAKLRKDQMGLYLGLENSHGDELKDIMVNAEDTIFKAVSKRYRKLTPGLLGRAM